MKISLLSIENVRCFRGEHVLNVSDTINLLVGPNNSGKTTILKSIHILQEPQLDSGDRSVDAREQSIIKIEFPPTDEYYNINGQVFRTQDYSKVWLENSLSKKTEGRAYYKAYGDDTSMNLNELNLYSNQEPNNILYPYFSNRKTNEYNEDIGLDAGNLVSGTLVNIHAKVDRLLNRRKSSHDLFVKSCKEILGFEVSSEATKKGKITAFSIDDDRFITLGSMGSGIASLLGMIVDLCVAKDKIFLIEEPENDIHPKALKGLLKLIEVKSDTNQFFISTHSNIVVKYLGSNPLTKIFQIASITDYSKQTIIPESTITVVGNEEEERRKLLEDLGYDLFDYQMWSAWLFLEESSAEFIIRDFLIPQFTNLKGKLATHSTRTIVETEAKFEDFNRLFVYIHQNQLYKNRAWVIIDAGDNEKEVIDRMKGYYLKHGWEEDRFRQFSEHDFEAYYPARFREDVDAINRVGGEVGNSKQQKKRKKELKKELLERVIKWYTENPADAKGEFAESASEVIEILLEIEGAVNRG